MLIIKLSILSVQNNWYSDGVEWHDSACYRAKQWLCEDSDKMVDRAKKIHPGLVI